MKRCIAVMAALALSACSMGASLSGGGMGEAGAQAGGAKDIGLARSKIAAGQVPAPEDFPVEGLYAEHDLPLLGAPCSSVLCLRVGEGLARPAGVREPMGFVQVGMSSNVNLATFRRGPLNLAAVIDHSGSMGRDKMEAVKDAVHRLIDKLDERDLLTVIEFDSSVNVLVGPEAVGDRERFHAQVRRIAAAGGTCIECGLKVGVGKVRARAGEGRLGRVLLFTDAQPNIGGTSAGDFLPLVRAAAAEDIGLTAFGVGLDFGQALVTALSAERGANYVYLETVEKTRTVFDQDFDFLVTPIAYDLSLDVTPADGVALTGVYGLPGQAPEAPSASLTVKTVFLSRSRGALAARLSAVRPGERLGRVRLGWTPVGGEAQAAELDAVAPPGEAPVFSQAGTRKTFALTELALGAREACAEWQAGAHETARRRVSALADFLAGEATALGDAGLAQEAQLMAKLEVAMGGS